MYYIKCILSFPHESPHAATEKEEEQGFVERSCFHQIMHWTVFLDPLKMTIIKVIALSCQHNDNKDQL